MITSLNISRDPKDFPRAKPEGNLEGRGISQGRRGWISHSLVIIREVLILTLPIFTVLFGCISWYSLAAGIIYWMKWSSKFTYSIHSLLPRECTSKWHPRDSISWHTPGGKQESIHAWRCEGAPLERKEYQCPKLFIIVTCFPELGIFSLHSESSF